MKIGILTFHWATNYGAVLQCYALQKYLEELGHNVEIINYKPSRYDISLWSLIRSPRLLLNWKSYKLKYAKEQKLETFRQKYLNCTKRYYTNEELSILSDNYDVVLSGSDQILNSFYTLQGERRYKPTSTYYLTFAGNKTRKIGYAVSFGCESYPEEAKQYMKNWIHNFDAISVREKTGLDILKDVKYNKDTQLVPDPTLLLGKQFFKLIGVDIPDTKKDYLCVYMLRWRCEFDGNVQYIDDENNPLTMEQWLGTIANAQALITNSYHGVIMAILAHVPFVVLLEKGSGKGMNDRFYTLLSQLGMTNRIANEEKDVNSVLENPIDFDNIDAKIELYRKNGVEFLEKFIY